MCKDEADLLSDEYWKTVRLSEILLLLIKGFRVRHLQSNCSSKSFCKVLLLKSLIFPGKNKKTYRSQVSE